MCLALTASPAEPSRRGCRSGPARRRPARRARAAAAHPGSARRPLDRGDRRKRAAHTPRAARPALRPANMEVSRTSRARSRTAPPPGPRTRPAARSLSDLDRCALAADSEGPVCLAGRRKRGRTASGHALMLPGGGRRLPTAAVRRRGARHPRRCACDQGSRPQAAARASPPSTRVSIRVRRRLPLG